MVIDVHSVAIDDNLPKVFEQEKDMPSGRDPRQYAWIPKFEKWSRDSEKIATDLSELENVIERGVVLSSGPVITSDPLPGHLTGHSYSSSLLEQNGDASLFDILEDIERRIIIDKLERCHWNQTDTAEQFRIPLSTLNQKIKRLNIEIKKRAKAAPARNPSSHASLYGH
jgi:hypothetical protein